MVQIEAKHLVPIRLDQLAWDFQVLPGGEYGRGTAKTAPKKGVVAVLFAAGRRKLLSKRMELVARAGISVDVVQSDCIALHNFLLFQRAGGPQGDQREDAAQHNGQAAAAPPSQWPVMLVDVGGDGSNLLVSSPAGLWVRHLGFGGYSITRALVRQFNLTTSQAEELKRNPAAAANVAVLYKALEPVVEDFLREIDISLGAYAKTEHSEPVRQMLGVGGGFALHGLLGYLRSMP
jgi:Tfp pilus assembly PilM family ATPase